MSPPCINTLHKHFSLCVNSIYEPPRFSSADERCVPLLEFSSPSFFGLCCRVRPPPPRADAWRQVQKVPPQVGERRHATCARRGQEEEERRGQTAINKTTKRQFGSNKTTLQLRFESCGRDIDSILFNGRRGPVLYKPKACIVTVLGTAMLFLTPSLFFSVARLVSILLCERNE